MATVICMASVKGGSGKTVLSATFGALLAAMGKRVLLVDTDAATNGLSLLYLDETLAARDEAAHGGVGITGTFELTDVLPTPQYVELPTGVQMVPATMGFFNTEEVDPDVHAQRLGAALSFWRDGFDYIILDAQAGSDVYAAVSMKLADRVVIVSEYDPLSAAGVERLKAIFPKELAYERTWVLLNKMLPELVRSYSDFMEVARYLRPIPWDADVVRAYSRRSLALDLEHGNEYTVAVIGTLRSLLPPPDAEALDNWVAERAAEVRTPLRQQAQDLAEQLKGLDRLESELTGRPLREVKLAALTTAVAVVISLGVPLAANVGLENAVGVAGGVAFIALAGFVLIRSINPAAGWGHRRADLAARRARLEAQLERLETLALLEDAELVSARAAGGGAGIRPGARGATSQLPRTYVRGLGDIWHWCRNCSSFPSVIGKISQDRPKGELCNECLAKERDGACRL